MFYDDLKQNRTNHINQKLAFDIEI